MPDREHWVFVFEALPGDVPAANRVRSLLKTALRRDGLKCVRQGESPELARLRQLVASLSDRVAAQAELLARRAEKDEPAGVNRPR